MDWRIDSVGSLPSLNSRLSPSFFKLHQGENSTADFGIFKPNFFAFNKATNARLPPADSPTMAAKVSDKLEYTVKKSSHAAGHGFSGANLYSGIMTSNSASALIGTAIVKSSKALPDTKPPPKP